MKKFDLTKIPLNKKWRQKFQQKLTGDLQIVAELCGVENALKLHERFRGSYIRVNTLESLEEEFRNEVIRDEYDGGAKVGSLAVKYQLTERQIWNILGKSTEDEDLPPLLKQMQ